MATLTSADWRRYLGAFGRGVADALFPPVCLACDQPADRQGLLCPACFRAVSFIAEPLCRRCGVPFRTEGEGGSDQVCEACIRRPPVFDRARAVWSYDAGCRPVILGFKHADRTDRARPLALLMRRAGAGLLDQADLLVPVPLHRRRLLARRYNQSALLAWHLGRLAHVPVRLGLLRRLRATPSLDHRSATERREVLAGAIGVAASGRAGLAGRRVVLIDDVLTSGATADACAAALLGAGAASVDVLAVARVPPPSRIVLPGGRDTGRRPDLDEE